MLLDGAVGAIQKAIEAFDSDDIVIRIETIHNQTTKAGTIIAQLRDALDFDSGGEFAARLGGLYVYIGNQLMRGNIRKDRSMLEEAKRHLEIIQQSWREMMTRSAAPAFASATSPARVGEGFLAPSGAGFSIQV